MLGTLYILYCDLALLVEHTGVYIGNNKIVHLDGSGNIEVVNPEQFLARLGGLNSFASLSIYVSCNGTKPIGKKEIATRAKNMVGKQRDYSLLSDNCHQFTAGCLFGNFDNDYNFFNMLKQYISQNLEVNNWRVWQRNNWNLSEAIDSISQIESIYDNQSLSSQKIKEVDKNDIDKQFLELASLLIHYVIDKKNILPKDILYFENLLQIEFNIYDNGLLKEMFGLRNKISEKNIHEIIIACYNYMPKNNFNKIVILLEKLVLEDNYGNYNKFRDINILIYNLKNNI